MNKIPTLYRRDPNVNQRYVQDGVVVAGCEWVLDGEGVPTRKYDGTCVMLDGDGYWWARREVKPGKEAPKNFVPVNHDPATEKTVGWEPIEQSPFAKFHAEALHTALGAEEVLAAGTYELCGPKVNGNRELFDAHRLIEHATAERLPHVIPTDLIAYCRVNSYEGVVWHHPDGRMAKLKVRDFPKPADARIEEGGEADGE